MPAWMNRGTHEGNTRCAMPECGQPCGPLGALPRSGHLVRHSVSGIVTKCTCTGCLHDGLGAVASASWGVWHCLCAAHWAELAREGIHTREGERMPIYDYYCHACDRTFEVHLSLKEHDTYQVQCPHCHSPQVEQAVTHFMTVTSKKS